MRRRAQCEREHRLVVVICSDQIHYDRLPLRIETLVRVGCLLPGYHQHALVRKQSEAASMHGPFFGSRLGPSQKGIRGKPIE